MVASEKLFFQEIISFQNPFATGFANQFRTVIQSFGVLHDNKHQFLENEYFSAAINENYSKITFSIRNDS